MAKFSQLFTTASQLTEYGELLGLEGVPAVGGHPAAVQAGQGGGHVGQVEGTVLGEGVLGDLEIWLDVVREQRADHLDMWVIVSEAYLMQT